MALDDEGTGQVINNRLSRHYRNRRGKLLQTLDEVVRAIVADDLMQAEPVLLAEAA